MRPLRRLGFSAVVSALLLAIPEICLRFLAPIRLNPEPGPLLRGELSMPGDHPIRSEEFSVVVHVNREGFVDQEWGPREGRRVVVIGDSFVQAAQVPMEAGFGRVLQARMPGVEVLSLGVPGAGTATELGVLDRYALPLQPDLVVLGFLVANDVLNNHPLLESKTDKPFFELRDGKLLPVDATTLLHPPSWLELHSQVAAQIGRAWARRAVVQEKIRLGDGVPVDLRLYDPHPPPAWEQAWAVTEALVAEMERHCASAGVAFAVLLFPDGNQASPAFRERTVQQWPAVAGWDFAAPPARAQKLAASVAATLDLLPALRGQDDAYFPRDGHWTTRGHRLAAEAAAPFLLEQLQERPASTPPNNNTSSASPIR